MSIFLNDDYKNWLKELKSKIQQSQIKAALAVNSQLILLYWDLGKQIAEKQENAAWGSGFINQLSKDLKAEFPDMGGFSANNLRYCKSFFLFYSSNISIHAQVVRKLEAFENQTDQLWEQVVPQLDTQGLNEENLSSKLIKIPWGHHILILKKIKDIKEAIFYINKTIENNWSRSVLEYQIEN